MPGFGAFTALVGLGAVAYLIVEKDGRCIAIDDVVAYINCGDDPVEPSVYYYP